MLNQKQLDEMLTTPSAKLIEEIQKIEGDIMILGAGGKMGPSLCILAANAVRAAGVKKRVIAVSRFSSAEAAKELEDAGVEIIRADLQKREELDAAVRRLRERQAAVRARTAGSYRPALRILRGNPSAAANHQYGDAMESLRRIAEARRDD